MFAAFSGGTFSPFELNVSPGGDDKGARGRAKRSPRDPKPQSGVVPYRWSNDGHLEVLLITSRKSGRWSIPKGHVEKDMTAPQSAAMEAFEEAGVLGDVSDQSVGRFNYKKKGSKHSVEVYPLAVADVLDSFKEAGQRKRRWFTPEAAARKINVSSVKQMISVLPQEILNRSVTTLHEGSPLIDSPMEPMA